jgi:hypothetical protein
MNGMSRSSNRLSVCLDGRGDGDVRPPDPIELVEDESGEGG